MDPTRMNEPEGMAESDETRREAAPSREPVFNLPAVVLGVMGLCIGIHLVRTYALTPEQDFELLVRTAFVPIRYSGQYQIDAWAFTSPFTYALLHGGFAHLIINMVWLAAFGSPLANRIGAMRFAVFFAVTGLAAAGLFYVIHPLGQAPLVGASGSISGMMGAAARFAFRIDRSSGKAAFAGAPLPMVDVFRSRGTVTFLAVWMVVNLATALIGVAPGDESQIAWEAHIGGFAAGFFGLRLFEKRRPRTA
jgi:membrane associated rhomboid family serine protease